VGARKKHAPRRGSLGLRPRKRASRLVPRVKSWPEVQSETPLPLAFIAYKAGMTHLLYTDARKRTPTSGKEVFSPITVVETPPIFVYGVRFYGLDYLGRRRVLTEVWAEKLPRFLKRRITVPDKVEHSLDNIPREGIVDVPSHFGIDGLRRIARSMQIDMMKTNTEAKLHIPTVSLACTTIVGLSMMLLGYGVFGLVTLGLGLGYLTLKYI